MCTVESINVFLVIDVVCFRVGRALNLSPLSPSRVSPLARASRGRARCIRRPAAHAPRARASAAQPRQRPTRLAWGFHRKLIASAESGLFALTCETTRQRSKNGHSGIHADPGSRPRNTLDRVTLPAQDAAGRSTPQVLGCGGITPYFLNCVRTLPTPHFHWTARRVLSAARFQRAEGRGPSSRAWPAFLTRKSATWRMSSPRR